MESKNEDESLLDSNKNATSLASDNNAAEAGADRTHETVDDPELNELLDSALADFDKPPVVAENDQQHDQPHDDSSTTESLPGIFQQIYGGGPGSEEAASEFEEAMKSFMEQDPDMMANLQKLVQSAAQVGETEHGQQDFIQSLSQTMASLAQNAEGLQQEPSQQPTLGEDDLTKMFSSMGVDSGAQEGQSSADDGQPDFMPFMHSMMKNLLSKDVLYPSLNEVKSKYPSWLEKNKATLPEEEYTNYENQYKLMTCICTEFEREIPPTDEEAEKLRFERVLQLMQEMQELGNPPSEIVSEMNPGLQFDENGFPKLPGISEACSIM